MGGGRGLKRGCKEGGRGVGWKGGWKGFRGDGMGLQGGVK